MTNPQRTLPTPNHSISHQNICTSVGSSSIPDGLFGPPEPSNVSPFQLGWYALSIVDEPEAKLFMRKYSASLCSKYIPFCSVK